MGHPDLWLAGEERESASANTEILREAQNDGCKGCALRVTRAEVVR